MESEIKRVTGEIAGDGLSVDIDVSELTKCALRISEIAFTALRGDLRKAALNIASAIVEYEDTIKEMGG